MRVSLAQPQRQDSINTTGATAPQPLLASAGPRVVLGSVITGHGRTEPVRPAADTLFGPRGAAFAGPDGPLFVCDTGHHRMLAWRRAPSRDRTPADLVFGQVDITREGRNGGGPVGACSLDMPTGIAIGAGVLAVADAWNHRVLLWHGLPDASNRPPDVVLGQADFSGGLANRGRPAPDAGTLNWCYGVAICDARLLVADAGNRRVLAWESIPERHGTPADLVLGQGDFATRDDRGAAGLRWPHAIAMQDGRLFVADAGTSRILAWDRLPGANCAHFDAVLGQADGDGLDHNRGHRDPGADTLNMPYGIAAADGRLLVADTANSRLLGYAAGGIATGRPADRLTGQRSFHGKGENRWEPPARDGLCWPYGISACGGTAIVSDSGNNRVLLWEAA